VTTELNTDEYNSTLTDRMINVTGIAHPAIDIWPYVNELVSQKIISAYVFENRIVEIVYQNDGNTFDHVLLPAENASFFIVIVIDLVQQMIVGHYKLDLNELYGLN